MGWPRSQSGRWPKEANIGEQHKMAKRELAKRGDSPSWHLRHTTTSWPNPRCFASHEDHPLFTSRVHHLMLEACTIETASGSNVTSRHNNKRGVWNAVFRDTPRHCAKVPCPNNHENTPHRSEFRDRDSPLQGVITGENQKRAAHVTKRAFGVRCASASLDLIVTTVR